MNESLPKHAAIMFTLGLIIWFSVDTHCFNLQIKDGMKVYSNAFTYIVVDSDFHMAQIYELDTDSHQPVLAREYWRGNFHLKYIQDNFYSIVNKEPPGEKCIENMDVSHVSSDSGYITARFRLGESRNRYSVMARSIRTDSIYSIVYPINEEMILPIDENGYLFSIMPSDSTGISMAGITYGFSPTLKYLNLPKIRKDLFSKGGSVEISLPFFDDGIFEIWCVNGEILQIHNRILNEKIIWHGKEFLLYERMPHIFNF
ncbi:MAG: hypothetical protein K2H22_00985 [Muribaculaceae bacterium]|nr:hypothetical protein [Muribaculaceae bacterium]MDE5870511.1 hypothetical protein [Muribaculaceae bacterium]